MEDILRQTIKDVASNYMGADVDIDLSYPELKFGDYATNAALKLAAMSEASPREVAKQLAHKIKNSLPDLIDSFEIAGPGFINLRISDSALANEMASEPDRPLTGQVVVTEFSDPNPFKLLHAGHLYTSIVGDSISRLLEQAGANVYRVNYGGDIGLHVARNIWAMINELGGENPQKLAEIPDSKHSEWMSQTYVKGTAAYDLDPIAKSEIIELNRRLYEIVATGDKRSELASIYWTTRSWSYEDFKRFYARINIKFDKFYPESEASPLGIKAVQEQLDNGVFEKSDGAVVFRGEKFGLHTRVFINSHGLPTYEAKDIGLAMLKRRDYNFDRSIMITGNDQKQYMEVVYMALEQFAKDLVVGSTHLTHGIVRMAGGKKMSSREGNIIPADYILESAEKATIEIGGKVDQRIVLAAIKYSFLKQRLGGDIIYDPKESVNMLGNSGPYLQYAHARAHSILAKAKKLGALPDAVHFTDGERPLVLKLARFRSELITASKELSPHLIANYIYDLSQTFNRFYETNRVIGDDRQDTRLYLTKVYSDRLKLGLYLLGIDAPEHL